MRKLLITAFSIVALTGATANAENQDTNLTNEEQFRTALSAPGMLSLKESQIALKKSSNPKVKEFATFEVGEQTAISTVLKELNTPEPKISAQDSAILEKLNTAKDAEFDKAYLDAQIDGHKKLKMITESYLDNGKTADSDVKEMHARHIALIANATIKQHLANAIELNKSVK